MPLGSARFGLIGTVGDSLELIQTQVADGSTATIDFTSIKESTYNVHFLTYDNVGGTGSDYDSIYVRLIEGGTVEDQGVYDRAYYRLRANGNTNEYSSSTDTQIPVHYGGVSNSNYEKIAVYICFYNLGDSNDYSFATWQGSCVPSSSESNIFSTVYGSACLPQQSTVDGIRIFNNQATGTSYIKTGSTFSLYGIKVP